VPLWTLFRLLQGKATTPWPLRQGEDGQAGILGMPRYRPELCREGCAECAEICPTKAITLRALGEPDGRLEIDYGRCVVCQLCTETCPTGAMTPSSDWAFGVRRREDLIWQETPRPAPSRADTGAAFRRSLHIRHVDAGSCNGCESELQALTIPFITSIGSGFSSPPRHVSPTFCWSRGR
jgi:formate hydrogenlyase subunit 6/NADH:ubiquinone oxidoreductase subunit I